MASAVQNPISRCVWVSDLSQNISSKELGRVFSLFGDIETILGVDDQNALIMFNNESSALDARTTDGQKIHGIPVHVSGPTESQYASVSHQLPQDIIHPSVSSAEMGEFVDLMKNLDVNARQQIMGFVRATKATGLQSMHVPVVPTPSVTDRIPQNVTSHNCMYVPRLSMFSGEDGKGEVVYFQWRNEVRCLLAEGLSHSTIHQSIRRSLKGSAASVLLNMGNNVAIDRILRKFDIVFGPAATTDILYEDFYRARQNDSESVVQWSCRIEGILSLVKESGHLDVSSSAMLRTKFWSGLKDEKVKAGLRHKYDAPHLYTYEDLLVSARSIEHEGVSTVSRVTPVVSSVTPAEKPITESKVHVQSACSAEGTNSSKLDEILAKLSSLDDRINRMESYTSKQCSFCKRLGHVIGSCRKLAAKKEREQQGNANVSVSRDER